jgi:SAM-dependent methyltransferase
MNALGMCVYCKAFKESRALYAVRDIFGNHFTINRCGKCKAYFLSPNPTPRQLSEAYDDSYYGSQQEKFGGLTERALDLFRKRRAFLISQYIPARGNLLDIGCGNGRFLKYTRGFGDFNLYGTEMPGRSANRAASHPEITLKLGRLEKDDFPEDFFDAVTLFHVFEHLSEPAATLDNIRRILKPSGVLVISFPNIASFQARLFKGRWLHLDPPRHLFFFEPLDFIAIAASHGLIAEKMTFFSPEQNPFGMIQSILNCLSPKREILFEALKGNTDYTRDVPGYVIAIQRLFFLVSFPLFLLSDLIESLFGRGATVQFVLRNGKND